MANGMNGLILPDIGGQFAAGEERGIRNTLLRQQVAAQEAEAARQQQYRNLLSEYMGGQQTPEVLNALYQVDPEQTAKVVEFQGVQEEQEREAQHERAREMVALADVLDQSPDPVRAFQIAGGRLADGSDLVAELDRMGAISVADGIQPEEVAVISSTLREHFSPMLKTTDRVSIAVSDMKTFNYPMTREGFRQYHEDKGVGSAGELEALYQEARLRGLIMDQDQTRSDREREERERERALKAQRSSVVSGLRQAQKIADITRRLEGTFVQPGTGAEARRNIADFTSWLGGMAGFDTGEMRERIDDFDQARKGMEQQVATLLETGGLGEATNAKLRQAQQRMANPEISPGAILEIQAQVSEALLDEADIQGFEIPNREKIEAGIDRMRGYSSAKRSEAIDLGGGVTLEFIN